MMLTKANSTRDPNINPVHPRNQISLAFIYETLGKVFPCDDARVMNDNIVLVPRVILGAD